MTKERLEEIIKQGGWIWILDKNSRFGLQLSDKFFIKDNFLRSELGTKYAKLDDIFETKYQAEWALKTVTERIERFEPPMWEDIDYYCFSFVQPNNDFVKFEVKKNEYIEIAENEYEELFYKSGEEATKENYEKACEMVRDLFKGEK